MKVHLKVTVIDRILEQFAKAQRDRREVECVTVTPREYAELCYDCRSGDYVHRLHPVTLSSAATVAGLPYTVREFALHDRHRGERGRSPYYRVQSYEKFRGKPLFVVPEYCVE